MNYVSRGYQTEVKHKAYGAWNAGAVNVAIVMPTGSGKTGVMADMFNDHTGAACAIAHRQELVGQISLAMARIGVHHNIIAPRNVIRFISSYHAIEVGRSYYHPHAPVTVAGVDTLLRRDLGSWAAQVTLVAQDECHHVQVKNKWGKAQALFPNARGVGFTATLCRADGRGLGRHETGIFDTFVEGPRHADLVDMGYLTDYRIFGPPEVINIEGVDISKATGDFNPHQLRQASHKSQIVGSVVDHYIKIAGGKLGVTFAVDVETATDIAQQYKLAGVPAEVVSAKTPDALRVELINKFRRRELLQLVNVDLFGEGFDLPAIEVVSMARHTASYSLFAQQFGRALRPLEGKDRAIIIDHVGNVMRHGLPDAPRTWSLDARERGTRGQRDETVIPCTTCTNCMNVYERIYSACPFCHMKPEPEGRSRPEQVDGDLHELTPEALAMLRGSTVQETPADMKDRLTSGGLAPVVVNSQLKINRERTETVTGLIESINMWGAVKMAAGDTKSESYRRFFHRFGMDVLTAQTLARSQSEELKRKIDDDYRI